MDIRLIASLFLSFQSYYLFNSIIANTTIIKMPTYKENASVSNSVFIQEPKTLPGKLPIRKIVPVFKSTRFNFIYVSVEDSPVKIIVIKDIPTIAWGVAQEKLSRFSNKNSIAGT